MNQPDPTADHDSPPPAHNTVHDAPSSNDRAPQSWNSRNRLYYLAKPWLPRRLRIAARRVLVSRQLRKAKGIWPIMPGTERKPEGWPGWPDGKKFAFVLTHDVEGGTGIRRCSRLARAEKELGFRSSFNFIPEGSYITPPALREELKAAGFEVGIHDLRHDGRLFESRERFGRHALKINRYLDDWGATGFRSGFMLRQSDWLHDLEIEYDLSTFDTDPFEPQPEGKHTIFPFWVPYGNNQGNRTGQGNGNSHTSPGISPMGAEGYIEMPYTLPQDSTLFVLLKERTPEIWLRKLDWIAANGGMALVNIHPDYLRFEDEDPQFGTYPFALVRELLDYVRTKYAGQYWQPCSRELARWYRGALQKPAPAFARMGRAPHTAESAASAQTPGAGGTATTSATKTLHGKRAAVVLYSSYPADPRPRRAAEALISAGMSVDMFCLHDAETEPVHETVNGVQFFRLPVKKKRGSKLDYLLLYASFIWHSFWQLARRGIGGQYDLVHVHNMPDALVFSALVPKLRGAAVMLDLHDPMPELMMGIYGLTRRHPLVKILLLLEKWSIAFSDLAITPNIAFKNLFVSRSCRPEKMLIVMNSPEEKIFKAPRLFQDSQLTRTDGEGGFRLMHHGSIVHRHGVDLLVEAVAQLRDRIPGLRLDIYGTRTPFLDFVLQRATELKVDDIVHYHGAKTQQQIAQAILECDLGVVPNRFSAFTNINFPTRLFEYLAMGRPVIAPGTRGILDYFGPDEIVIFKPDDVTDLAEKIHWVYKNPDQIPDLVERGADVYRNHPWNTQRDCFIQEAAALLQNSAG
jgi:glycosyltransferase involved in cell wall biosynthesis/peptidoglycan/xylan/chitin deacetylase (PgdA/CDA1 family)